MLARSFQQHVALCLFLLIQLSVQSSQQFYKSGTLTCKGENKVIAASELKIWSATECVLFCKSSSSSVELVSVYHEANFTCQCFNMVSCTQADQEIKKAKQNETLRTVTSVQVARVKPYSQRIEEGASFYFNFDSDDVQNRGLLGNKVSIGAAVGLIHYSNGIVETRQTFDSGSGLQINGLRKLDIFGNLTSGVLERSTNTGFSLSFMAKDMANSSTASYFLLLQEQQMNGFQLSRNDNLIRMSLSADDFVFDCEFSPDNYGNASIWHHYGVSFRIVPSPKLSCYVDGNLYKTQFQKSPRTHKVRFTSMQFGWMYSSAGKNAFKYDEVAFWERYIELNEMKRIYEASIKNRRN